MTIETTQEWDIGDCLELLPEVPDKSIDLMFADPPYNVIGLDAEVLSEIFMTWLNEWTKEIKRVLKPSGTLVFCGRPPMLNWITVKLLEEYFVLSDWITWHKLDSITHTQTKFSRNYEIFAIFNRPFVERKFNYISIESKTKNYNKTRNMGSVWEHPKISSHHKEGTNHPTQKPEKFIDILIRTFTDEGDCVLDTFLGSGVVLKTCMKLNRNCVGFDISDKWEHHYEDVKLEKKNTNQLSKIFKMKC